MVTSETSQRPSLSLRIAAYLALCLISAWLAMPFFWMLITAVKSSAEISVYPPTWLPTRWHWENYALAWSMAPFGRFYVNSIATGVFTTVLQVVFSLFMAYAFVFIRFPAKNVLLMAVLATMMIPDEMKLVPNFLLLYRLGWIDTYYALIIPPVAHAFPVFVLYQQLRSVPRSLVEAAQADGASHFHILVQVIAPISRPVLAAATLVALLGRWNDYLWPLVVTNSERMRTLPIGMAYLRKQAEEGATPWNLLMASAVFVVIPIVLLYTVVQRQFVEGITRGALKG